METINIALGGIPLALALRSPVHLPEFAPFATDRAPLARVRVPEETLAARLARTPENPPDYEEMMALCPLTSDALIPYGRMLIHGAALLWRGRAWLLTGPSGTGKTTQYVLWKEQFPREVGILNGDKPVLELRAGEPWLHASPWSGKEGMSRQGCAPLGGIVLLEQGAENRMTPLAPGRVAGQLFMQLLFSRSTPAQVRQACALLEGALDRVPLWRLVNRGDPASARLCHDTLEKEALG